jgi:hypothetical protein
MKVTGFTFVRNAVKYDYPVVESITSVLPVCNDFVVAVGKSDDNTLDLIKSIDDKRIRIIETVWDDCLREGGRVLAKETDKALKEVPADSDWGFYIQGDEVVHEKYLDTIRNEMLKWKDSRYVDGLLFKYLHFYGSYDYIGESYRWYRREIRIIRPGKNIYSYRDAQGFRKNNNKKLKVKLIDAFIYHYGWVKEPRAMQGKQQTFHKYWHNDEWIEQNVAKADEFDYSNIDALSLFKDSHPKAMEERIKNKNWKFDYDLSYNNFKFKDRVKRFIERITGYRVGEYRNYKIV